MGAIQEKVQRLQELEQSMQTYGVQRRTLETQLLETESALEELGKGDDAYRIVGNIMVRTARDGLVKELEEKRETLKARTETVRKQEERVRKEAGSLQQEVMGEMGDAE